MLDKSKLIDAPERRGVAVTDFEFRKAGDSLSLRGYASVFDSPYDVYGGAEAGGWSEVVDKRAFDVTLGAKPDLHLLINHEGLPLARTKSGTMNLSVDSRGLLVDVPNLDRRDPDVQRLEVKMARGDMDEMSFAFRTKRDAWNSDESERRLLEVSLHKGDVSVVNFGANPATSVALRSFLARYSEDYEAALEEARGMEPEQREFLTRLLRESAPVKARTTLSVRAMRDLGDGLL